MFERGKAAATERVRGCKMTKQSSLKKEEKYEMTK